MSDTPELTDPKWDRLKIATLREASEDTVGFKPKSKTLREAWHEVVAHLEKKGRLPFLCGKCNSPIDDVVRRCWACGAEITDEPDEVEEPEMSKPEIARRADNLGVGDAEDATSVIEAAEKKKAAARKNVDLTVAEAQSINQKLTEMMGDGWRKKLSHQYTTYSDPNGVRRIAVFHRGLGVHFSVDDDLFVGKDNSVEFYDVRERRKRHYGRTNFSYVGDVSRDAIALCKIVFDRYSGDSK